MIRSIRPMLIACLSLSLSMTMVACGGDDDGDDDNGGNPDAGSGGPDAGPDEVEVLPAADCTDPAETITTTGLAFTNGDISINVGDTVLFMPAGGHDMVSTGNFDTGALGTAACLRFNEAGEYDYVCSAHASMTGTVTVAK
jgi:plastocyanin